jgi:hypothetical protein
MALKPCRECGEKVSTWAKSCPKCGRKNPTTTPTDYVMGVVMLLCLLGFIAHTMASTDSKTPSAATLPVDKAAIARVTTSLEAQPDWQRIEIGESPENSYSFTIHYKDWPEQPRVEADTRRIAHAVLAELMRQGHSPAKESITVFVAAHQDGLSGETGQPLVRDLGMMHYDYNSDTLKFTLPGHLF